MPLLGGACKLSGVGAGPTCSPGFTGGPYNVFDSYPSPAKAGVRIGTDGSIREWDKTLGGSTGRWDNGGGGCVMSDFDFRFDTPTGAVSTGAGSDPDETWINGGSSIDWFVFLSGAGAGVERAVGTIRIRPAGGGADIDTVAADFEVDLS